jgi:holliday junction DNA helicase RuvA
MFSAAIGTISVIDKHLIDFTVGPLTLSVQVPDATLFNTNAPQKLSLYLHWHQENGPTLFGFQSAVEKELFICIVSCSGIGPKIALALLASLGPNNFAQAIISGNHKSLSAVPGIGTKKAEQIIFGLKTKIDALFKTGKIEYTNSTMSHWNTVSQALESLNYSRAEIQNALDYTREKLAGNTQSASFDQLMRCALAALSKQK